MTLKSIKFLYRKYHLPVHVIGHILKVTGLTLYLTKKLNAKGINVNERLVRDAALLHDLIKVCDFKSYDPKGFIGKVTSSDLAKWQQLRATYGGLGHERGMSVILENMGQSKIAEVVRKHRYDSLLSPDAPRTWEEKIVYYSDKRVMHDRVVSLNDRLEDGRRRYQGSLPLDDSNIHQALTKLENEICSTAGINPDDICDRVIANSIAFKRLKKHFL
jgi:hypothetical protein